MLYNKSTKNIKTQQDCAQCPYFNEVEKKCEGIGKNCFEYDPITKKAIDPITRLVIKV